VPSRRTPAAPSKAGQPGAEQPAAVRALGDALLARADDRWRRCEDRLTALGIEQVGTAEFRARRRACQLLGVELFARWMRTGAATSVEERTWLSELGEMGAQTSVSIAHMTRGYLMFRDVVWQLIEEEAARLETPAELLGRVNQMNSLSCDSSILWMTRAFDRQTELQETEALRLHSQLAASEARFRSVFGTMTCGLIVVAADGTILDCNEAAAEMLEFTVGEFIGRSVFAVSSAYRDESGAPLEQVPTAEALATRTAIRGRVVKHDFGDGRPVRWHRVDAVPVLGPDGELLQVLATFVDVTSMKTAEELRAENEAKNRFLATMSHELRTPLNSILGFAQLLQAQGELDPTQRRYLRNIETSGGHLLSLISDILELSQAAAGEIVLNLERVEVAAVIRQVAVQFEPMFTGRPIELRLQLRPGLFAHVDALRLRQVLVNLVANALKFTEEGSVTVSTHRRGHGLEVRVADSGIGIPPDQIERVLDEFTQVDGGATRTRGGVGLGLPLSRRLVEIMGGTFSIGSTVGRGTTATVVLPLAD
jgi:PAS domain S-box-containing protein